MKKLALVLFYVLASTAQAQSIQTGLNMEGDFEKVSPIVINGYKNRKSCQADKGRWINRQCVFSGASSQVSISKNSESTYQVTIQHVGHNAHTCDFQGTAVALNQVQLVSRVDACEITVGFTSPTTLAIMNNGQCADHCGANMDLSISDVRRVSRLTN